MAVGIFDSGLGGLTVLDAVSRRLPELPLVYFGDNAHRMRDWLKRNEELDFYV